MAMLNSCKLTGIWVTLLVTIFVISMTHHVSWQESSMSPTWPGVTRFMELSASREMVIPPAARGSVVSINVERGYPKP